MARFYIWHHRGFRRRQAMFTPGSPAMTLLLGALVASAPLAMDIYLPSMPAMTHALGATAGEIQLTLSVYMFGWGAAQLLAGPLSDRCGRRPALIAGLMLFTAASVACALAYNVVALIVARFFQAVAVATVAVVPRAVVRDLHAGEQAAHMLSTMMLVLGVMPVFAPVLGAELHLLFGWRANFAIVAVYGAALLVLVLVALPETLLTRDRHALAPPVMLRNWRRALASRRYVGYALTIAAAMSGLFAFLAGSAFVFVEGMGRSERVYGLYFALVMLGTFVGTAIARRVTARLGIVRMVRAGSLALLASGGAMALLAWSGVAHPLAVVVPMLAFMAAYMCTVPQATAGALTPFPEIAGSAASLMSFVQFVIAASTALVVGLTFDGTPRPMATAVALAGLAAYVATQTLVVRGHHAAQG
jgi:DHA1 family bicyclomycin/chloramphenicol resistance-like MFS transporter